MELKDFIEKFAGQFDDTDVSEIKAETKFKELDEWDSLMALNVIGVVRTTYGKVMTGMDIRNSITVEDLFNLLSAK